MTREEAISIIKNVLYRSVAAEMRTRLRDDIVDSTMDRMAIDEADGLVALGILKLDEPKSYNIYGLWVPLKAVTALNDSGWDLRLFKVLDDAGLRIVEK